MIPFTILALSTRLVALAQTAPPVDLKTQDVPIPPAVTLPGPPSAQQDVPNRPLSADEAVQIGLRLSPSIVSAQAGVAAAHGRLLQARSGLNPSASVSSGYTNLNAITGPVPGGGATGGSGSTSLSGFQSSLVVRQLLLDFNHTRDTVRQAGALQRVAEQGLSGTRAGVVLAVKQAFYTYTEATHLVEVNEANVKSEQNQLALAQARFDAGIGAPADVVQAKTNLASGETALNQAQSVALQSRVALAETIGVDPRTPIVAADTHEPTPSSTDVTAMVDQALKQRPEMLQAQESVHAASFGVSAARSSSAPVLSANAALNARGSEEPLTTQYSTVGLSISWPLGDGGLAAGKVREAKANLDAANAQLKQTSLSVTQDVSLAYVQLKSAEQAVTIANAQLANAQESVRLAEGRYRAGVTTFIEVTTAQAALIAAETAQVNAVSAVDQARANLAKAIGASTR